MTDAAPQPETDPQVPEETDGDDSSLFFGGLLALLGHVLPVVAMYIAAQWAPVGQDGFGDLANALTALLIGEIVLALVVAVGAVLAVRRGHRRFASGLIVGWVLGAIAGYVLFRMN